MTWNWITYLKAMAVINIIFGLGLLTHLVTDNMFGFLYFRETGTPEGFSDDALHYLRVSHGVMGALIVGWMTAIYWLVRGPVARGDRDAWVAVAAGLAVWFLIDSTFSLANGYWENALLNLSVVLGFLPGLLATRPSRPTPE